MTLDMRLVTNRFLSYQNIEQTFEKVLILKYRYAIITSINQKKYTVYFYKCSRKEVMVWNLNWYQNMSLPETSQRR
jgi:hypothetical protein